MSIVGAAVMSEGWKMVPIAIQPFSIYIVYTLALIATYYTTAGSCCGALTKGLDSAENEQEVMNRSDE